MVPNADILVGRDSICHDQPDHDPVLVAKESGSMLTAVEQVGPNVNTDYWLPRTGEQSVKMK